MLLGDHIINKRNKINLNFPKSCVVCLPLQRLIEVDSGDFRLDRLEVKVVQELEGRACLGLLDGRWEEPMMKKLLVDATLARLRTSAEYDIYMMEAIDVDNSEIRSC